MPCGHHQHCGAGGDRLPLFSGQSSQRLRWMNGSLAHRLPSLPEAHQRLVEVVDRLQPVAPKVARLLEAAEAELLAFYQLPREHWSKLRSTNPLERVNREIGRRTDVVGIFPNDASLIRLAGALLIEQTTSGCSPAATSPRNYWSSSWSTSPSPRRSLSSPRPEPPTTILSYTTSCDLTNKSSGPSNRSCRVSSRLPARGGAEGAPSPGRPGRRAAPPGAERGHSRLSLDRLSR